MRPCERAAATPEAERWRSAANGLTTAVCSRFATRQVLDAATVPADSTIRILICNVQMENRKAQDIISLVHQYEPDLFLVLEGDDWWDQELRVLDAIYPLTIRQPQDNRYGIHCKWLTMDGSNCLYFCIDWNFSYLYHKHYGSGKSFLKLG